LNSYLNELMESKQYTMILDHLNYRMCVRQGRRSGGGVGSSEAATGEALGGGADADALCRAGRWTSGQALGGACSRCPDSALNYVSHRAAVTAWGARNTFVEWCQARTALRGMISMLSCRACRQRARTHLSVNLSKTGARCAVRRPITYMQH